VNASTVPLDRDELRLAVSTSSVHSQPGDPTPHSVRPDLRLAPEPAPIARKRLMSPLAGALAAVGVILVTLIAQLGLSIAVSEGAYEARALQVELRDLTRVERVLSQNAAKLSSPQNLVDNAVRLGMVQNTTPATLRLSDAVVLGNLSGPTTAVAGNLVANSTLEGLPVIDANGLLSERNPEQAALAAAAANTAPISWEGPLPAPQTH
jgi:hypothetical protein